VKILIAPDKFKGSLTAREVCDAIASALIECYPSLTIQSMPLADGGEGTFTLLTEYSGGKTITTSVSDPLFRKIEAQYGISNNGKIALIEMAQASGLQLLTKEERNPLLTTSFGTGELIGDALDRGATTIILGIGGSATNDAGMGAAEALGFRFYDKQKNKLKPVGENLQYIDSIDHSKKHPRSVDAKCIILCDVNNPLHGPDGAAYVFAPQKGADMKAVQILDKGLHNIEDKLYSCLGLRSDFPGAGAAGGIAVLIRTLMATEIKSGFTFIADYTNLEAHIINTDVVITGEGNIDKQTLSGKVVSGVAALARRHGKPVFAVTGKCDLDQKTLEGDGISEVIQLVKNEITPAEAIENAFSLLKTRCREELFPLLKALQI
jgi:glycerate kinase